tara:strand:- start:1243 stop:1878 length:636 start_codon:yes stop_codon:yes gene_type:complete
MRIDCHPCLLICVGKNPLEVIMNVYDEGYKYKTYRGSAHFIGGNPSREDNSPEDVLIREINEEVRKDESKGNWADEREIALIREAMLVNKAFGDYFVNVDEIPGGVPGGFIGFHSIYSSEVEQEIVDLAKKNINSGKRLLSEGSLGVFTIEQLVEMGELGVAHAMGPILGEFLGVKIPYPIGVNVERMEIGPRDSFDDYRREFEYSDRCFV